MSAIQYAFGLLFNLSEFIPAPVLFGSSIFFIVALLRLLIDLL